MSIKMTRILYGALIMAVLEEQGYEVSIGEDGFIQAESEEKDSLLILPKGRCLSDIEKLETAHVCAEEKKVDKLKKKAEELESTCIPCIGFGIGKYSYCNSEICIVPTDILESKAKKGTVYSISSKKYYYNYTKVEGDAIPPGAILRMNWNGRRV